MEQYNLDPLIYRYFVSDVKHSVQDLNRHLKDINMRLIDLETTKLKNGKNPEVPRAAKVLLMEELGIIEFLIDKKFSQKKISKILSLLINADNSNIESDLGERHLPKSTLKTKRNYQILHKKTKELKLNSLEDHFQEILDTKEFDD